MRLQCLLLLAPCLALVVLGQETAPQATVTTGDAGEQENPNNGTADTKPRMPTEEAILSQMPPITPLRSGVPSLDAFYMLFPALGSLLRWGALFPAPTILGAVPDSLQPTAAASKVVLVLADDPTAKTRVPRQDAPPPTNPFGQFLAQMPNANFAQGLMNPANFNPDNFNLGQMAPNVGQALTNMQLPPMPAMPQFGFENILGAAPPPPPAALPPAPAEPAPPADKPADEPAAPVAAPNPFAFLNPSNFDMNQMLGQAQQSLPPMPSGVDFFSNLRQMWPGAPPASPAPGSEGQASDISEIRVRPEEAAYSQDNDLDEKERVPLLWFRMPMNRQGDEGESKPLEDLRVEAKLRAFERQVIAELKMLQQIERVAKEMRSSAASSSGSGSPYKISYPLSRTPVHKITRADIEQALRDDYVRRLLHKEAQRKSRVNHAAFKRQTMPADASMSKEDIVKIMAYAYRMATEQQSAEKNKEDKIYAAYRATGEKPQQQERQMQQQPMMMQQQPMPQMQQRQWEAEKQEAKMQQNPMMMMQQQPRQWEAEQNEAKMQQQRQMMAEQQPMMMQQQQRQWEAEQKEAKIQQNPMMMQQRQWEAEQKEAKIQQNPMMMQQRQWEAEQQQQRQMMAEQAQMQQQPMMHMQQRMEQQQQQQPMITMQEPMRMEQQPMMMQQRQMAMEPPQMQQNPMMQMQQRQWEAEQKDAKLQQQRQWEAEQNEAKMQQNPMMIQQQQRQWEAEQNEAKMQQQQRQWEAEKQEAKIQQSPMMMQQRQWEAEKQEDKIQQNPMMMQQRQWEAEKQEAKIQQNPMMMQQRQWEAEKQEAKIQQNPMMMQQQQRQMTMDPMQMQQLDSARQWGEPQGEAGEEGEAMLGEAEPQMPEVPGQARHKGVDMLGLGGNKRKKSKHGQGSPTVINYYAVQQQQYPRPQPSYGTSYGGGGYGSNAYGGGGYSSGGYSSGGYSSGGHSSGGYSSGGHSSGGYSSGGYRAALGNDEVDEMLRQHQTMARTINPGNPNGVQQQEQEQQRTSNQTTPQLTPTQRLHKRLAIFQRSLGCGCASSHCRCGRGCQCSGAGAGGADAIQGCRCRSISRRRSGRQRRDAEYGTLETIDESSLNALRREYKTGLKEITLSPDEDPAEALMRYNAASIREALERASREPLEVGGDDYAEGVQQEQEEEELQQQHPHHHHNHHHQPEQSYTPQVSSTTETTAKSVAAKDTPDADADQMQQDSAVAASHPGNETLENQTEDPQEELVHLHSFIAELKTELAQLTDKYLKLKTNLAVSKLEQEKKVAKLEKKQEESPESTTASGAQATTTEASSSSSSSTSPRTSTASTATSATPRQSPAKLLHANAIAKTDESLDGVTASASDLAMSHLEYEDEKTWQRLLANRGYDTEYLTKSHERQYAEGQDLELPKAGSNYEPNGSSEDASYADLQSDSENKAKRSSTYSSVSVKQQAALLNAALDDDDFDASVAAVATTPSPYAMRGKFVRRRSTVSSGQRRGRAHNRSDNGWQRATRQAKLTTRLKPVPEPAGGSRHVARISGSKLDQLVDVLNDLLQLQVQRERQNAASGTAASVQSKRPSSSVLKRKRVRRRQQKPQIISKSIPL